MSFGAGAERDIDGLIARALAGDNPAWMRLLGVLWERVETRVGHSRRMGQLRGSADDRREVVSRVFARLRRNDVRPSEQLFIPRPWVGPSRCQPRVTPSGCTPFRPRSRPATPAPAWP